MSLPIKQALAPITALFTRSLRLESRQLTLYLARLALLVVIGLYLLEFRFAGRYFGAPGLQFFKSVVYINLIFITLAGMSYFASAITEEKEEMTLGLLRMTRLSPLSILLGKSTARMLGVILLLIVQFPFTLLAVTLGGVAPMQIVAAYATLLAYVVLVSGLALCCSVVMTRNAGAGRLAGVLLLGFLIGLPIGNAILSHLTMTGYLDGQGLLCRALQWVLYWLIEASPFTRVGEILQTGFSSFPAGWQVASNVAAGALFFLAAWAVFDLFTRQQKEASPARGLLSSKRRSRFRLLGPGRTWRNALAWKDFNFVAGGWTAMVVKFVVFGAVLAGIYLVIKKYDARMTVGEYCAVAKYVMAFALLLEMASYAAHTFNEEVKWQTLPTIVMLPITIPSLAYRKVAGSLLGLIPSATYMLLAAALSIGVQSGPTGRDWYVVHFIVLAQAVFFVHLAAYLSLVLKRGAFAAAIAIWVVGMQVLLSLLRFFLAFFLMRLGGNGDEVAGIVLWGVIPLLLAALLHWQIGRRLRKVAASQ